MSNKWYARPVLFVADIDRSVDFYVKQLGFTQAWRYEEEGKAFVAQVDRRGLVPLPFRGEFGRAPVIGRQRFRRFAGALGTQELRMSEGVFGGSLLFRQSIYS